MVMAIRLDALQPIDLLQLLNDVFAQVDAQDPTVRHLHSKPQTLFIITFIFLSQPRRFTLYSCDTGVSRTSLP